MEDNTRKVEAVIKGVTADRKQLILSKDTRVKSFDPGSQGL